MIRNSSRNPKPSYVVGSIVSPMKRLTRRLSQAQQITVFLIQTLQNEESQAAQAVLCTGICKLVLAGIITDANVGRIPSKQEETRRLTRLLLMHRFSLRLLCSTFLLRQWKIKSCANVFRTSSRYTLTRLLQTSAGSSRSVVTSARASGVPRAHFISVHLDISSGI